MLKYDHIVIGDGINGSCTAYQLAKRGTKVLLLEKFPLPHSRGSSHGQSRGIRRAYPDAYFTQLMETAYKEWHEIEEKSAITLIKETGLLCFTDERENQFLESVINSFNNSPGAENTVLNSADMREKYPYISCGPEGKGCLDPSGGVIFADKAMKAVQDLCLKLGVHIKDGDGVEEVDHTDQGVRVRSTAGLRYEAKSCVICAGPWAGPLLERLGYRLPLRPVKIPVYYWRADSSFLPHTWIYEGAGRMMWGLPSLEYPGLVKICPHDGPEIDPDYRDSVPTADLKLSTQTFIRKVFPGLCCEVELEESCIYTLTPDHNPIIDTLPDKPNIAIGAGFSGTGFKLGPVTGSMLADLAQGKMARQTEPLLALDRFNTANL